MPVLQTFRNYQIAQDPEGAALEVWRCGSEVSCLVWDSERQRFGELHVAIAGGGEVIDPAAFQSLVQKAAVLRHPHILPVHEGGEDDGASFYVTDLLEGERLEPWLHRQGALPPWLALQLLSQIASALCAVAPHADLLAGVNLLHSGVVLTGEDPAGLSVRLADWGFTAAVARGEGPRAIESGAIRSCGQLLGRMLTGTAAHGDGSVERVQQLPGGEELAYLLSSVFRPAMPHHPKTMEQFLTLVERCCQALPRDPVAALEQPGPEWRPRLPLVMHFPSAGELADALADEYVVDARGFDAASPYAVRATRRATRQPARVQLLPPDRLCGHDWAEPVAFAAGQEPASSRHLLRLLSVHSRGPRCFVEESTGRWTLERMVRLRGRFGLEETAMVLSQLEAAAREAEQLGLPAVLTNPREIGVVFGSAPPSDAVLAEVPLMNWPKFLLRVRTWPVTLQFSQPEAWEPESLVRDAGPPRGPRSWDAAAGARDFALLAAWMLGGMAHVPESCRSLLQDALRSRSEAVSRRSEFTDALALLAGTAPASPMPTVRPTELPPASPVTPGGKGTSRSAGKAGKDKRRRKGKGPAAVTAETIAEPSAPGGTDLPLADEDDDALSPSLPGFAEALFGAGGEGSGDSPPDPEPSPGLAWHAEPDWDAYADDDDFVPCEPAAAAGLSPWGPTTSTPGFATGLPGEDPDEEITPDQQGRARLVAVIVVIAAVVAALAAHFTGTGFWLR